MNNTIEKEINQRKISSKTKLTVKKAIKNIGPEYHTSILNIYSKLPKHNPKVSNININQKMINNINNEEFKLLDYKYGLVCAFKEDNDSLIQLLQKDKIYQEHVNKIIYQFAKPNSLILDVGSNIGVFTLSFAKLFPTCQVWSFEMMPNTFQCLERTCQINKLNNVVLKNIGLMDKTDEYSVRYKKIKSGQTYITDIKENDNDLKKAKCTTLDSFELTNISFIKMDIQGAEYYALLGAKQTLINNQCVVLAEFSNNDKKKLDKTIKYLDKLGYEHAFSFNKEHVFIKKTSTKLTDNKNE
jgi:FkbM family methyltransferase